MSGPPKVLLTIAGLALATPASTQAPIPTTAFDGTYAGVSRAAAPYGSGPSRGCVASGVPAPLTITNGVVHTRARGYWEGRVSPQGAVGMRKSDASRLDGQIDSEGTLRGQISGTNCVYTLIWRKQSR
jgi:hypothetical protein